MLELEQAFPPPISAAARAWFVTWRLAALADEVRISFSRRMFRSVGRCYPARRRVALAQAVREMSERHVLDILCHELAHIAAFEHFGTAVRAHGAEWRQLVRDAGFEPRVRFVDEHAINLIRARACLPARYLHRCPVCARQRMAARRMPRWRCGACYAAGREGRLDIVRLAP